MRKPLGFLCAAVLAAGFTTSAMAFESYVEDDAERTKLLENEVDTLLSVFGMDDGEEPAPRDEGPCSLINITEPQKTAIKDALFAFKKAAIQTEADVKLAYLGYEEAVFSDAPETTQVEESSKSFSEGIEKLVESKMNLKTNILFTILTAEQRKPADLCIKLMHKRMMKKMNSCGDQKHGH